jgi:hypothetical protein
MMPVGWIGLDWGNVPGWVGTVVTSTSVTIAALSYRRSVFDRQRQQASFIAAWVGLVEKDGKHRRALQVSNGSDASVYEVAILLSDKPVFLTELPAKTTSIIELLDGQGASVAPIASMRFWVVEVVMREETVSAASAPEIEFRDAAGRMWRRDADGKLKLMHKRTIRFVESTIGA